MRRTDPGLSAMFFDWHNGASSTHSPHHMDMNSQQIGKGLQLFGWFLVLFYAVKYGLGIIDTLADASVRVYAPLIVLEGALYAGSGLLIVWLGSLVRKKAEKRKAPESDR